MRIPFRSDFVSLNLSLVFSIVAAVLLRSVEVLLLSIWPNLSRFNLSKRVYTWVRRSLPGSGIKQVTRAKMDCNTVQLGRRVVQAHQVLLLAVNPQMPYF